MTKTIELFLVTLIQSEFYIAYLVSMESFSDLPKGQVPDWDQMNMNLSTIAKYYQQQMTFTQDMFKQILDLKDNVNGLRSEMNTFGEVLHNNSKEIKCLIEAHDLLSNTVVEVHDHIRGIKENVSTMQFHLASLSQSIKSASTKDEQHPSVMVAKYVKEQLNAQLRPISDSLKCIQTMIENHI